MEHATIRRELATMLAEVCAPARVVEEEADLIAGVTVMVCWTGANSDQVGWQHHFEVRTVLSGHSDADPHFAERDNVVRQVARAIYSWAPADSRKASRPELRLANVTVGGAQLPATVCRVNVFEPPEID